MNATEERGQQQLEVVHVAGPIEREPDPASQSEHCWVQRCLRCDDVLWRVSEAWDGEPPNETGAPRLRSGGTYALRRLPDSEAVGVVLVARGELLDCSPDA